MTFRGLKISVETDKGELRHWYDPHNKEHGTTKMKYPYGYIRRTEGVDGDHVDCYVGPHENAPNVYIVHQTKAPGFTEYDEDKCLLGFRNLEEAKKAYLAHYNDPRFLGSITKMSWQDFEKKVKKTFDRPQKIAAETRRNHVKVAQLLGMMDAVDAFFKTGSPVRLTRAAIKKMSPGDLIADITRLYKTKKRDAAYKLLEMGLDTGKITEESLKNRYVKKLLRKTPESTHINSTLQRYVEDPTIQNFIARTNMARDAQRTERRARRLARRAERARPSRLDPNEPIALGTTAPRAAPTPPPASQATPRPAPQTPGTPGGTTTVNIPPAQQQRIQQMKARGGQ